MNLMTISASPIVQAVGWALLHLVWEGFLVAAILAAALALMQRRSANARYLVSCGALLLLVALAVVTAYRAYNSPPSVSAPAAPAAVERAGGPAPAQSAGDDSPLPFSFLAFLASHLPEIVAVWFIGVMILSARLVAGWICAHRIARRRAHAAAPEWERALRRIAAALDLRRPIRLLESAAVEVPTVVGWLRPIILLPVATLSGLSLQQVEMILAHEVAHIRHHDFIINLLQSVVETLLFYHPAVWWMSQRIREEREHCCDDLAVSLFGDAMLYAYALTRFEELRMDAQTVVAAGGGSLLGRIRRLVAERTDSRGWTSRWAAGAALLTVVAVILAAPSLPLFADHPSQPAAAPAAKSATTSACNKAPTAGVKGGVTRGVTGGVTGSVTGGVVTTSTCNGTAGTEVDVDAETVDTDADTDTPDPPEPPEPPQPAPAPAPTPFAVVAPNIVSSMVTPWVQQSVAFAKAMTFQPFAAARAHHHPIGEGGKLSVDDLITLKSLNVTPQYIEEMRGALGSLSLDDVASLRMAGVTPAFVQQMVDAGYKHLAVGDLVAMHMQGLTPEFVKSLADAGYANLPVKDLLRLRAMGVDADFIRELQKYRTK